MSWGTDLEINFIKQLGSWRSKLGNRKILLKKYIRAAKFRTAWDGIDQQTAISVAEYALRREENGIEY